MKIAVIGGSGMAGSAIVKEAASRGNEVAAFVRDAGRARKVLGEGISVVSKDAFALQKADLESFDVVVDAFRPPVKESYRQVDLAARLVALFRETEKPRLFFILGAGSLLDADGRPFLEAIRKMPGAEAWVATPEEQFKELAFLRGVQNVNWVGVSPSARFEEGPAHPPKLGTDHLLTAEDGASHVTNGTLAAAVLNEIEHPSVRRGRFTVSD